MKCFTFDRSMGNTGTRERLQQQDDAGPTLFQPKQVHGYPGRSEDYDPLSPKVCVKNNLNFGYFELYFEFHFRLNMFL